MYKCQLCRDHNLYVQEYNNHFLILRVINKIPRQDQKQLILAKSKNIIVIGDGLRGVCWPHYCSIKSKPVCKPLKTKPLGVSQLLKKTLDAVKYPFACMSVKCTGSTYCVLLLW